MARINSLSDKVAIATSTLYNPDWESYGLRAELAKKTIINAKNIGYEISIVDGGSSDELLKEFERYGAKVIVELQRSDTMGAQRRNAIEYACNLGRDVIVWMEPEKETYVSEIEKTVTPIIEGSAEMVIPRRKSLESYPVFQQHFEQMGNIFWKDVTGTDLDVWFGPRTWKKEMSRYFLDYKGEYGDKWDSIFVPVVNAIFDGRKVISVDVDYIHPKKQTEAEEHNIKFYMKRVEQLDNLTNALYKHWKKLNLQKEQ